MEKEFFDKADSIPKEVEDEIIKAKIHGNEMVETKEKTIEKKMAEKADRWEGVKEDLNLKDLADEFRKLYTQEEQERILNGLKYKRAEDIGIVDLQKYINFKKYGKK